jgi:hypothetical protein
MKFSILVSLVSIATIASAMQTASAQESRGARFNYAPNVWKSESARLPKGYGNPPAAHTVQAGAVPSGNLLGLDPTMLTKPAPPPIVATQPAMMSVTPRMFAPVPTAKATFNPMFGTPQAAQPQSMPQQAPAMPMQMKAAPANHAPVAVVAHHSQGLSGRLMHPPRGRSIAPASATPAVASYAPGVGYSPGPLLPSTSSGGMRASTSLNGVIIGRKHK